MKVGALCVLATMLAACGSEFNMPFSNANPAAPDIHLGSAGGRNTGSTGTAAPVGVVGALPAGARNEGTQVWMVPVPAGDVMRLAQNPEMWPEAQKRVDVVSLYHIQAYDHPGFECGDPCGPNSYQNMVAAVPAGMFKWLSDRFILGYEGGSVKPHVCTPEQIDSEVRNHLTAIANITKAGGRLSYISLDEPFTSGTWQGEFWHGLQGCGLSAAQVAGLQRRFNDGVHAVHPEVQIGLIEPYPHFTVDQIMSFVLELEGVGIELPYFHLDMDVPSAVRQNKNWKADLPRLREFFRAKGIPFGVILWGWDGRTNEQYAAGYWGVARTALMSVGVTEHTVLQSWAEDPPGSLNSLKHIPDTVPESNPATHTGLLLATLDFMHIRPGR